MGGGAGPGGGGRSHGVDLRQAAGGGPAGPGPGFGAGGRAALERLRARLPFPLRGVDCDNGSEFLNAHLVRYCQAERLTLTRCRADHKNDQAHVEQKNWSVVRQLVGYDRYEGAEAVAALEAVYALLHVYVNGYLPVMKLVGKEREGTRVRKRYDTPQT